MRRRSRRHTYVNSVYAGLALLECGDAPRAVEQPFSCCTAFTAERSQQQTNSLQLLCAPCTAPTVVSRLYDVYQYVIYCQHTIGAPSCLHLFYTAFPCTRHSTAEFFWPTPRTKGRVVRTERYPVRQLPATAHVFYAGSLSHRHVPL